MQKIKCPIFSIFSVAIIFFVSPVYAGGKIQMDETKWISIGAGLRASYATIEDAAPNANDWSTNFALDNMRLYVNGQLHKYIKLEFNTDCTNCFVGPTGSSSPSGGTMIILDAIGKFEFNQHFNIWAGRLLAPSDRAELDGPYYQNTYEFNKTPFYPQDFSNPGAGLGSPTAGVGGAAGRFGRDEGINIWGAFLEDKRLTYVVGIFDGLDGFGNTGDSPLWACRFTFNFLNVEQNPGYYTSSTYYGKGGDIFTVAFAIQHQAGGAGTAANPANFTGYSVDALYERVFSNNGVLTLEGEYKGFETNLNAAALASAACFCIFDGDAWTATGLYLFPQKVGIGQFQPYVRFTENKPDNSTNRTEFEVGTNYVIDGHNARVSLFYQYGDIATKGRLNWTPGVTGANVSAIKLALQLQL